MHFWYSFILLSAIKLKQNDLTTKPKALVAPYSVNEPSELWETLNPLFPGCHRPNNNPYQSVSLYTEEILVLLKCVCVFPGLSELIHDNLTESKRTINLLQRMNIYQEVFLSILYRLLPIQVTHPKTSLCVSFLVVCAFYYDLFSLLITTTAAVVNESSVSRTAKYLRYSGILLFFCLCFWHDLAHLHLSQRFRYYIN